MTINHKHNAVKFGMIIFAWIVLSMFEEAKAQDNISIFSYTGLEGSFGVKSSNIKSNIPELQGLSMLQEGGNIGLVFGNDFSVFIVRPLGFYSASGNTGRTINLFAVEAENNTYLIKGIFKKKTRLDIYSSLGMNFNSYKFFGHYINDENRPSYNNKPGKEPFLGKTENLSISYGLGIEYNLVKNGDFVNLFMTAKSFLPMEAINSSNSFTETYFKKNLDLSIGLRFGLMKRSNERFLQ